MEATTLAHFGEETSRYGPVRVWGSIGFIVAVVGGGYRATLPLAVVPFSCSRLCCRCSRLPASYPKRHDAHAAERPSAAPAQAGSGGVDRARRVHGRRAGPDHTFYSIHLVGLDTARRRPAGCGRSASSCEMAIFAWMPRLYPAFTLRQILIASFALAAVRFLLIGWLAQTSRCCSSPRCCTRRRSARFTPHRSAAFTDFRGNLRRADRRSTELHFRHGRGARRARERYAWEYCGSGLAFTLAAVVRRSAGSCRARTRAEARGARSYRASASKPGGARLGGAPVPRMPVSH